MTTYKALVGFLILLGSALLVRIPVSLSQGIALDNKHGEVGETIAFTVWIDGAPRAVDAFGFDIVYNSKVLQYTGTFQAEELSRGFDFFNVHSSAPGRVRVGGFTTNGQIEEGSSGRMVTLEFTVINPGNTSLSLVNPVDDVAGWPMTAGIFNGVTTQPPRDQPAEKTPEPGTDGSQAPSSQVALSSTTDDAGTRRLRSTTAGLPAQPPKTSVAEKRSEERTRSPEAVQPRSSRDRTATPAKPERRVRDRSTTTRHATSRLSEEVPVTTHDSTTAPAHINTGDPMQKPAALTEKPATQGLAASHALPTTVLSSTKNSEIPAINFTYANQTADFSGVFSQNLRAILVFLVIGLLGVVAVLLVGLQSSR